MSSWLSTWWLMCRMPPCNVEPQDVGGESRRFVEVADTDAAVADIVQVDHGGALQSLMQTLRSSV